jgi:hypothetical protein
MSWTREYIMSDEARFDILRKLVQSVEDIS